MTERMPFGKIEYPRGGGGKKATRSGENPGSLLKKGGRKLDRQKKSRNVPGLPCQQYKGKEFGNQLRRRAIQRKGRVQITYSSGKEPALLASGRRENKRGHLPKRSIRWVSHCRQRKIQRKFFREPSQRGGIVEGIDKILLAKLCAWGTKWKRCAGARKDQWHKSTLLQPAPKGVGRLKL